MLKYLLFFVLILFQCNVLAIDDEKRFQKLTSELRCLVCQNQSLFDSDAPLANQLKEKIHEMILAGKTDPEIIQYLSDRYGEFILYKPPLKINTAFLWFGPLLLVLIVAFIFIKIIRQAKNHQQGDS